LVSTILLVPRLDTTLMGPRSHGAKIWYSIRTYRPVPSTTQNDDDRHLHSKKIDQLHKDKINISTIFMIQMTGYKMKQSWLRA